MAISFFLRTNREVDNHPEPDFYLWGKKLIYFKIKSNIKLSLVVIRNLAAKVSGCIRWVCISSVEVVFYLNFLPTVGFINISMFQASFS